MFKLAKSEEIGQHLSYLINKKYKSVRQFGKAYIEEDRGTADNEEIRKMSNRLSQILGGKKSVQIYDLPIFTKLLDVSCEEILSAGTCFATTSNHLTNYAIATSKDKKLWESYVKREDQLILNADEYGKTVIDYALDSENYEFVKFLMDNGYIWFVGTDELDLFHYAFGAGTSIERNPLLLNNLNVLGLKMQERYELRMKMIVLAIKRNDIQMLTELHAREIPPLYQACLYSGAPKDFDDFFDEELIKALAGASDEILEYFSKEFEITNQFNKTNRLIFPFLSELINALLESNNDYIEWVLKDAIFHNQYAYDKLSELLALAVDDRKKYYLNCDHELIKKEMQQGILRDVLFFDHGNLVKYIDIHTGRNIVTNLIQVTKTSNDTKIKRLIQELNDLYNKIQNITPII
ncbi:MAG: hypothetical protein IJ439_07490 [Tyzzerella sp.]|nr:hypothetical protein [Tyzzerella sp.]